LIRNLESALEENSESLVKTGHELRTPLNAVIGYGRIIRRQAEKDGETELKEQSTVIMKAGNHLLTLINNMLDLAKSDAGRMELNEEFFEMAPLIEQVQNLSAPLAESNNNNLTYESEEMDRVYGDATRLQQILLNLTSNACKFTRDGTVKVSTSCCDDFCEIVVEDTGIGIDEDMQDAIFEPYTQASNSTYSDLGGTGLGLAISHRLAKLMNGELEVESTLGQGSRFTLSIPMANNNRV
jgi:signal transduction histidine kinase